MRTRHTFVATLLVALLALAGVTAALAADPGGDPPPRLAFLANGRVPADALAAGSIAGQLGAPVYTTEQHVLPDPTADALSDYSPELVIVLGGSVAISDAVVAAVGEATGLPTVDPTPPPSTGIVRAAGHDRFATAAAVADLLAAYDPAYLGVDRKALDSDRLDGKDSSEFALKSDLGAGGGDADTLDGKDSSEFLGTSEKAADADLLDGTNSSAFVTKGTFVHNALGDWRANGNGTDVTHFTNADTIHANSQVTSTFPAVHNGDNLALDAVRLCVQSGGGDISGLNVQIWETGADGTTSADSTSFTWDQGSSGCQDLDITPHLSGIALDQDNHVTLWMTVSGDVRVSATTFRYFRPITYIPMPISTSRAAGAS